MTPPFSPGPATGSVDGLDPIHISKSAIAAVTLPLPPSEIWRVMVMGAPSIIILTASAPFR